MTTRGPAMIRTQAEWISRVVDELADAQEAGLLKPRHSKFQATAAVLWPLVAPLVAAVEKAEQTIRDAPHFGTCADAVRNGGACFCWKSRYLSSALTRGGSNG